MTFGDHHFSFRYVKSASGITVRGAATAVLLTLASFESANAAAVLAGDPIGFGPASSSSWLVGAVAGYNWQQGAVVFGFEGDISWTGLKSETTGTFSSFSPTYLFPSS